MHSQRGRRAAFWLRPRLPAFVTAGAGRLARTATIIAYDHGFPSVPASLAVLRTWGFHPRFAIDGGAYVGDWTRVFESVFPDTRVLLVEPQASKQDELRAFVAARPAHRRLSVELLGPTDTGEVDFYEMETGSSVLSELTPFPRNVVRKSTRTLDAVVADHADWGRPDFVKLDVQGFELAVLAGGPATFATADFVLLEASLSPYNAGAPLLAEVITTMDGAGFIPIDLCSQHRRSDGALRQTDVLFMNRACSLADRWSTEP